jgi:hypothetical protein
MAQSEAALVDDSYRPTMPGLRSLGSVGKLSEVQKLRAIASCLLSVRLASVPPSTRMSAPVK